MVAGCVRQLVFLYRNDCMASKLIVLDKWSSYRDGRFSRFDYTWSSVSSDRPAVLNIAWCKYYDLQEVQLMNIPNKNRFLSLIHSNTCSLNKNFDGLEYLIILFQLNQNQEELYTLQTIQLVKIKMI